MPNVEMIEAALQSENSPKTFDDLVEMLDGAGYSLEASAEGEMGPEAPEDMGPEGDIGVDVEESMNVLEDLAPEGSEPMITGVSGVMRDKTRTASKNALDKHKGEYA